MSTLRLIGLMLFLSKVAFTQVYIPNPYNTGDDIEYVEYFFNLDPGLGSGTSLAISPGQDVTYTGQINLSSLPSGLHMLHVRAKDAQGKWSLMQSNIIFNSINDFYNYGTPGANIVYLEYFIDIDPGLGLGTSLPITAGQEVTFIGSINVAALSDGPHLLHLRAKDAQGKWSLMQSNLIYKSINEFYGYTNPGENIIAAEYFIDTDPGLGLGEDIPVTASQDVCINDAVCISGLTSGDHYVHVRAKDQSGKWSLMQVDTFQIASSCEIYDPLDVMVFCDDNNTPDLYYDDTFEFSMVVRGVNIDLAYTLSGDITAAGNFDCDVPTTFNNGGSGYSTQNGDLNFDITDDLDPGCTKNWTIEVPLPEPLSCSNADAYLDPSGNVTLLPSLFNSSFTCGVDTITLSQDQFDCSQLGSHTLTIDMLDVKGNMDQCMVDVSILDTISPTVLTQDITIQLDVAGQVSIQALAVDAGSFDNCALSVLTVTPDLFTCNEIGSNVVSLYAEDASGNSKQSTAMVTVEDNLSPQISCQDITIQLDASGLATITAIDVAAITTDNCGIASSQIDRNNFDCTEQGTQSVVLTVTDVNGNTSSCMAMVEVTDPLLSCCQSVLNVTDDPIGDGTYSAFTIVQSATTVPANGLVIFHAGTSICLDPGFEIGIGADFEAYIEPCVD